MARIISIISGKGGAGKTVVTANLGVALAELGEEVTIIDCNLTTPNLGLHLGIPTFPKTLHDVLKGDAKLSDAIYEHDFGLRIIPAGLALSDLKGVDASTLSSALLELVPTNDIILIDGAAGLGKEALAAMEASDELLIITNPELPAALDALKAIKLAEQLGSKLLGVVLNRVSRKPHELSEKEIEDLLELPVLAKIPEDENIKKSIAQKIPVVKYNPYAPASLEFKRLAGLLVGKSINLSLPWWKKLFWFLR